MMLIVGIILMALGLAFGQNPLGWAFFIPGLALIGWDGYRAHLRSQDEKAIARTKRLQTIEEANRKSLPCRQCGKTLHNMYGYSFYETEKSLSHGAAYTCTPVCERCKDNIVTEEGWIAIGHSGLWGRDMEEIARKVFKVCDKCNHEIEYCYCNYGR